MLGSANRAVDPREEDRHGLKTLAIGDQTGGDVPSGLRTSHHDGAHWPLLPCLSADPNAYAMPVKIILTQPRHQHGTFAILRWINPGGRGCHPANLHPAPNRSD